MNKKQWIPAPVLALAASFTLLASGALASGPLPNDPDFTGGAQWDLRNTGQGGGKVGADIDAVDAWGVTTGSSDIYVEVIGSGVDYTHPDIAANIWSNPNGLGGCPAGTHGLNVVAGTCEPMDDTYYSHETGVASVIGAVTNNGIGTAGVAWKVTLIPCKAFDSNGQGSDANVIRCLQWGRTLKEQGVNLVATNNSYGHPRGYDQDMYNEIAAQMHEGILFVAQAGNTVMDEDNDYAHYYPCNYKLSNVVCVAATDRSDKLWAYSGYGGHSVSMGAPGADILTAARNDSWLMNSGTSFAAAHVSGAAALLKAQDPRRDWRAIKNLLLTGGTSIEALHNALVDTVTGKRLNVYGSMICQNSTLLKRLSPDGTGWVAENVPMGTTLDLSVLHVTCDHGAGPVYVHVEPGNQNILLRDDITDADHVAGDGKYHATWTPLYPGDFTLTFPNHDQWQAKVLPTYTYRQDTYQWRTFQGTSLDLDDDDHKSVTLPFPIQIGGVNFTTVDVDSNGKLNFEVPGTDWTPVPLPNPAEAYTYMVAPWWDDDRAIKGSPQNVYVGTLGSAPYREFVVEWRNVSRASGCDDPNATVTFQAVFDEGSTDISFNYADTIFGGAPACAVGDHGGAGEVAIQGRFPSAAVFEYKTPVLTDGMSLRFSLVR